MFFGSVDMDPDDEESLDKMREMFGPMQIDQQIRQAIQFCWMGLPPSRTTTSSTGKPTTAHSLAGS